jgi:chondroitin-sulfate-ABC endolyase/exolyase
MRSLGTWLTIAVLAATCRAGAARRADAVNAEHARIRARYVQFLLGSDKTFSGPMGPRAHATFQRRIAGTIKKAMSLALTRDADKTFKKFPGDAGFEGDAKIASNILERHLLALAYGYSIRGVKSPYYRKPEILARYAALLKYLHSRGVRKGMTFHRNRLRMNMSGAPKPQGGAGNLVDMELRMGAYCQSILIMAPHIRNEPVFAEARALVRFLEMLGRSSGHVRYYEPYKKPEAMGRWVQSDAIQIYSDVTLVSAMLETDPARRRELLLDAQKVFSDSLRVTPGWADTIKPDFVGYHHRGIYGNAYTGGFIPQAAFGVYLLNGTSFAVAPKSVENLKQLMLTYRLYCQKYAMPFGIRGRMPSGTHHLRTQAMAGFVIYASSLGLNDASMKPVFARIRDSGRAALDFLFSGGRGKLFRGMYVLDMLDDLDSQKIKPEPDPQGFWYKPYGGLAIHRRDNWMASVKGASKYIWDYETGKKAENRYGQYLSGGMLTIFASGDPISDIASGYNVNKGWDWYRLPGVTAVHFPMRPMSKPLDHRRFSGSTFLGGASADGRNGAFGMILDTPTFHDGTKINLKARKSMFFADDLIVMLGSGISGGDGKHNVETTIFQSCTTGQQTKPAALDGKTLTDPQGNGYYVPVSTGLKLFKGRQKSYLQNGRTPSQGDYATAWLDHGLAPKNASYEIAVGVRWGRRIEGLQRSPESFYRVLRRDNRLHAVRFPRIRQTAYAIFEPHELGDRVIASVNAPCLIVAKETRGGLLLGVSNPDLAMVEPDQPVSFKFINKAQNQFLKSRTRPVKVTLNGLWTLTRPSDEGVKLLGAKSGKTTLQFDCRDGMTRRVTLFKVGAHLY